MNEPYILREEDFEYQCKINHIVPTKTMRNIFKKYCVGRPSIPRTAFDGFIFCALNGPDGDC